MFDFNASLAAVDGTMTLLEQYCAELSDIRAASAFALSDLMQTVEQEVVHCTNELETLWLQDGDPDTLYETATRLRRRLEALEDFQAHCKPKAQQLLAAWNSRCRECDRLATDGRADTGRYLQKLNGVVNVCASAGASGTVRTVILDSARYPQTAEHIRIAQNRGQPQVVTLDRSGAAARRNDSLAGKPTRSDFDRDEYPCAMFVEGGAGADVAYIEGSDNRGSGSSLQWQLRTLPDGTQIRVRII